MVNLGRTNAKSVGLAFRGNCRDTTTGTSIGPVGETEKHNVHGKLVPRRGWLTGGMYLLPDPRVYCTICDACLTSASGQTLDCAAATALSIIVQLLLRSSHAATIAWR